MPPLITTVSKKMFLTCPVYILRTKKGVYLLRQEKGKKKKQNHNFKEIRSSKKVSIYNIDS